MFVFDEDFSLLYSDENRKLSKALAAFRRLFDASTEQQRRRLTNQAQQMVEWEEEHDFELSRVATTMHIVEPAKDGAPMDFEVPPRVLLMAIEKWRDGEEFIPDCFTLRYEHFVHLHPSYGAKDGV